MHSNVNPDKLFVTKTAGILIQYNLAGSVIACSLNVTHSALRKWTGPKLTYKTKNEYIP